MNGIDINDWVIVSSPGGRFLGRVAGSLNPSNLRDGNAAMLSVEKWEAAGLAKFKDGVVETVSDGDCIELFPALDFLAPLRPVQTPNGMAMTRDPIVVPTDFAIHPVSVFVKASAVYFCCDLQEEDRTTYKELVESGLRSALEARARASGLTLAGAGALSGKGLGTRG